MRASSSALAPARVVACPLLLAGAMLAAPVRAEQADAATRSWTRKAATEAVEALERGDVEEASIKLEKAYAAMRVPSLGLWSARALARRGLLVEASERYLETTRLTPTGGNASVHAQAKADAERELEALTPRIPQLRIDVAGALEDDVRVTLNGHALPSAVLGEEQPINPGSHRVVGEFGDQRLEQSVSVSESDKKRIVLEFKPSPAQATPPDAVPVGPKEPERPPVVATSETNPTLAFVALGAGGVGLLAGGVLGGLALSKKNALEESENCRDGQCLASEEDEVNAFRALRTASTVSFIAGGVFTATGVVLLIGGTGGSSESAKSALRLSVMPRGVALGGDF